MKKIDKSEPRFFTKFIRTNKPVNWDGINEIRFVLRTHILKTEQNLQCAYCESAINSDKTKSHIDHFKRKHLFPELTFNYYNLLVSCNNPNRCASTKDSSVKSIEVYDNIINPVTEKPHEYYDYNISGKLISKNKKAKFTEDIFNLNHAGLRQQRSIVAMAVQAYKEYLQLDEVLIEIGEFESFIRHIWE
jgi:uncharacterized protein (TIGR02646 family)